MAHDPPPFGDRTDSAPRPSPQTDPTNPHSQEAAGEWVNAERANERRLGEPGLTDSDRQHRGL